MKTFADDKFSVAKMMISVFDRVENVGKRENAGYQHFLLFPQSFQKAFQSGSLKVRNVWERVKYTVLSKGKKIHNPVIT